MNGHQITAYAESQPNARQAFCADCGASTIMACPHCSTAIRGYRHMEGVFYLGKKEAPRHCIQCGKPYPWQAAALENLQDILKDSGLSVEDMAAVDSALPDIISSTPKTESASLKFQRILAKLGKPVYDVAIKVTSDIASETAKKTLGL